ncbi:hypothetical protein LCGC14_2674310 [marine sediment metagenome]|uniref:Uncharacterized protein n=1 Tax=marine sediment metagenome TaxID=412755 RepID=A0A0F9BY36_9ZZZZ
MATTASRFSDFLRLALKGRYPNSSEITAFETLQVATDGTQEASKFITTDANSNQGIAKVTAWHLGTAGSETQVTATPKEINQGADMSSRGETLAAAEVLTVLDNGKVLFLNAGNEFQTALPLLSTIGIGWHCKFIVGAAPASGSYTIIENASDSNKIVLKGISETETDDDSDGVESAGASTITVKDGIAVVGDWIDVYSDGTFWFVTGNALADGGFEIA